MSKFDSAKGMPQWADVRDNYIERGLPGRFVLRVSPNDVFFVDEGGTRIGGRFRVHDTGETPSSPLSAISIATIKIDGAPYLEISTTVRTLYRNFYLLLTDVTAEVLGENADARTALASSLARWNDLLREVTALSVEQQTGLFAELYVLRRAFDVWGVTSIDSWTGPERQSHDFRFGSLEFEVKGTLAARRVHKINGLNQLVPTPGAQLYIVSVRLESGGTTGLTLPELIGEIRKSVGSAAGDRLEKLITASGYRDDDASSYTRRYRLADLPTAVPVMDGCPRITPQALQCLPSGYETQRIVSLSYDIDLTGLGYIDGTPQFLNLLPALKTDIGV